MRDNQYSSVEQNIESSGTVSLSLSYPLHLHYHLSLHGNPKLVLIAANCLSNWQFEGINLMIPIMNCEHGNKPVYMEMSTLKSCLLG